MKQIKVPNSDPAVIELYRRLLLDKVSYALRLCPGWDGYAVRDVCEKHFASFHDGLPNPASFEERDKRLALLVQKVVQEVAPNDPLCWMGD